MKNYEYRTKDIGEASALYALGQKFIRLDSGDNFYWFVFEDKAVIEETASYWCGDLVVRAKAYYDAMRTLKTLVYSKNY